MIDYQKKYEEYLNYFNQTLSQRFSCLKKDAPSIIKDAMRYAVEDGGKRVRPVLCYSTCEMLGGKIDDVKEIALAIEFIHSYSLVHDDLPCMDNDDYRRGKFSTHKKFGENFGVLAGDALLNFAFETLFEKQNISENYFSAVKIIADNAGYSGMIGGQVLDLKNENNFDPSEKDLYNVYKNKTAKLIETPILTASRMCGDKYYEELFDFGYNLGVLFQITDDIMDEVCTLEQIGKTPHKDADENKLTSVKLFGLKGAENRAEEHYKKAKSIMEKIDKVGFLTQLCDKMFYRRK